MGERAKIGYIPIDSGGVVIGDPCYLMEGTKFAEFQKETKAEYLELGYSHFLASHSGGGIISIKAGPGDGMYPVYVEKDAMGKILKITVEFIVEDDCDS